MYHSFYQYSSRNPSHILNFSFSPMRRGLEQARRYELSKEGGGASLYKFWYYVDTVLYQYEDVIMGTAKKSNIKNVA